MQARINTMEKVQQKNMACMEGLTKSMVRCAERFEALKEWEKTTEKICDKGKVQHTRVGELSDRLRQTEQHQTNEMTSVQMDLRGVVEEHDRILTTMEKGERDMKERL